MKTQTYNSKALRFFALAPESFAVDIVYCSECHKPITDKVYGQYDKRTNTTKLRHLHCALKTSIIEVTRMLRKRARQ